ncbi:Uncharacterised protein family (UPF0715) [Bacillus sp. OV322]|uniref:UPF0715 family protein n=1 Tax=Bacillus sp. OV322 TaxID=1882764 RepID=UPI0008F03012|nr:UPF0715 family protein [Bacillus sp. OV322]SFD03510.1 Uncharacterised protein family (UPF0715) [Bacillus sp. OV322]
MQKKQITSELILNYILCLIFSSLSLSFTLIFLLKKFSFYSFWGFIFIFLCISIIYLIFAVPLQFFLNKKQKRFHFIFFIVYLLGSSICSFVITLLSDSTINPFFSNNYYIITFFSAFLFWIWDSVFLQK